MCVHVYVYRCLLLAFGNSGSLCTVLNHRLGLFHIPITGNRPPVTWIAERCWASPFIFPLLVRFVSSRPVRCLILLSGLLLVDLRCANSSLLEVLAFCRACSSVCTDF